MWPDKTRSNNFLSQDLIGSNNFLSPDLIGSNQIGSGLVRSRLDLVRSTQIWLDLLRSNQIKFFFRDITVLLGMYQLLTVIHIISDEIVYYVTRGEKQRFRSSERLLLLFSLLSVSRIQLFIISLS